jgi:hypothetical protein
MRYLLIDLNNIGGKRRAVPLRGGPSTRSTRRPTSVSPSNARTTATMPQSCPCPMT